MIFSFLCTYCTDDGEYFVATWSGDNGDLICTQADTFSELIKNVKDAVECHLKDEPRAAHIDIILNVIHATTL